MKNFPVHTAATAPEASKKTLEAIGKAYGFVPNIMGVMAEAPSLLNGYAGLSKAFSESSLTAEEQQIVLLVASRENQCGYCLAAHGMTARGAGVSAEEVESCTAGMPLGQPKLEALRLFVGAVVRKRGFPDESQLKAFLDAGYTSANILEVILGVGLKVLSNYTNHIAETPVDSVFKLAPASVKG